MAGNAKTFFLLPPALAVDGDFTKRPYLWDLNVADIGVILPTKYIDPTLAANNPQAGVKQDGFEVSLWSHKEIRYLSVLFDATDFADADAMLAYIEATIDSASETLQKYTGWSKHNFYKTISPTVPILVNNKKIRLREYVPSQNKTNLYVDLGNTLQYDIFTVDGDATQAKSYYYTGVLA